MCAFPFAGAHCAECVDGLFGDRCDVTCDPQDDCSGHGICDGNGKCVCVDGFAGEHCDQCAGNMFGDNCDIMCTDDETCSANGFCQADGSCRCEEGYMGTNCDRCEDGLFGACCGQACDEQTDCDDKGLCNGLGQCVCLFPFAPAGTAPNCDGCVPGRYQDDCEKVCIASDTCSGNGECDSEGDCACFPGFAGAHCDHCVDGFFGPNCGRFCQEETTCSGHGVCDFKGECECDEYFSGPNCQPIPVTPYPPRAVAVEQEGYDSLVLSWEHADREAVLARNPMRVSHYIWEAKVCYIECSSSSSSGSGSASGSAPPPSTPPPPAVLTFDDCCDCARNSCNGGNNNGDCRVPGSPNQECGALFDCNAECLVVDGRRRLTQAGGDWMPNMEHLGEQMAQEILSVPYPDEAPDAMTCSEVCHEPYAEHVEVPYQDQGCLDLSLFKCDSEGCEVTLSHLMVGARVYFDVHAINAYKYSDVAEVNEDVLERPPQAEPSVEVDLAAFEAPTVTEALMTLSWPRTDFGDRRPPAAPYRTNFCYLVTFSLTSESAEAPSMTHTASICVTEHDVGSEDIAQLKLNVGWDEDDVFYIQFPGEEMMMFEGGVGGDTLEIDVAGRNTYAMSAAGETDYVVLGLADRPELMGEELDAGINVSWTSPEDTGYGDDSLSVTTFLAVSKCSDFDRESEDCTFTEVELPLGAGEHSYVFPEDVLVLDAVNYVRMRFQNSRGFGPQRVVAVWYKVVPILLAPLPRDQPYVALLEDGVAVWQNDVLGGSTFRVVMQKFLTGAADLDVFSGNVYIPNRQGTPFLGTVSNVEFGDNLVTSFDFLVPRDVDAACGTDCTATVVFSAPTSRNALTFRIRYFTYPDPNPEDIFPVEGSRTGNTLVNFRVTEFFGPRTREGAGLPYMHKDAAVTLVFKCVGEDRQASVTPASINYDASPIELSVRTPRSPCSDDVEDTLVQIFLDGEFLPLQDQETFIFSFRKPRIVVTPSSAFIPPGNTVELTVRLEFLGICFADDCGARTAGDISQLVLTIDGAPISYLSFAQFTTSINFRVKAPGLPFSLAGSTLSFAAAYPGVPEITPAPFVYSRPPPPRFIRGSTVIDGASKLWMALGESNVVEIAINNLLPSFGRSFVSLEVSFNDEMYSVTTFSQVGQRTEFSVTHTPTTLDDVTVVVRAIGSDENVTLIDKTEAGADYVLSVRNLEVPRLVSFNTPPLMVARGGTFLLATIERAGALMDGPAMLNTTISFDCGGATAPDAQEMVPYNDWSASGQVAIEVGFTSYLETASTSRKGAYSTAVRELTAALDDGENPEQEKAAAAVVLFQMPDAPSCATTASMLLRAGDTTVGTITLAVAQTRTGPATVASAVTPSGAAEDGMSGGAILTVTMRDFSVVESVEDVIVEWDGEPVEVFELVQSTVARTVFKLLVPSYEIPVQVAVDVFPAFAENNRGTFDFQYNDDRSPEIVDFAPPRGYADGGWRVTVDLIRFDTGRAISCVVGDTPVNVTVLAPGPTPTLQFVAPPGTAGSQLVTISRVGSSASFTLQYMAVPAGAPVIESVTPPRGPISGLDDNGEPVVLTAAVTSIRRIPDRSKLGIMFNNVTLDLTDDDNAELFSSFQSTVLSFTLPASAASGNVELKIWNTDYADLQGMTFFEVFDAEVPSLELVFPQQGPVEVANSVGLTLRVFQVVDSFEIRAPTGVTATVVGFEQIDSFAEVILELTGTAPGTVDMDLAVCTADVCANSVPFSFSFFAADQPRVLEAFPAQIKLYGTTIVTVIVENLPAECTAAGLELVTSVGSFAATSVLTGLDDGAAVTFSFPPQETIPVSLDASIGCAAAEFSAALTDLAVVAPRAMEFSVIIPPAASLTPSLVIAGVYAFPGFPDSLEGPPGEVILQVERAGLAEPIPLVVLAVEKYGAQPGTTQDVGLVFVSPFGDGVTPGTYTLRAYHIEYPYRTATTTFVVFDEAAPQVTLFTGDGGNAAAMSESTAASLVIQNPPAGVSEDDYVVFIGTSPVQVDAALASDLTTTVFLEVPPSAVEGVVPGLIAFGDGGATCTASCCPDACEAACGDVATACFTVDYYQDQAPRALEPSALSGPEVGGTQIEVVVERFPVVTNADVKALFGQASTLGTVFVIESTAAATTFKVVTPGYDIGEAASLTVTVSLQASTATDSASVTFSFTYLEAPVEFVRALPTKGIETGGVSVQVEIDFFPFPATPLVQFGSLTIADENVTVVPQSSVRKTWIKFLTPKTAFGPYEVRVSPKRCGSPCADLVRFNYFAESARQMELADPVPSRGAQQLNLPIEVFVRNFPSYVTDPAAVVITATGSETGARTGAVTAMEDRAGTKKLTIQLPSGATAASAFAIDESVEIMITPDGTNVPPVSFTYTLFDATARRTLVTDRVRAPVSSTLYNKPLEYQVGVQARVANWPQHLSNVDAYLLEELIEDQPTQMTAQVVSVVNTVTCFAPQIGCNRTRFSLLLPPVFSPGVRQLIVNHPETGSFVLGEIDYVEGCDYAEFCGSSLADYLQVVLDPSPQCKVQYCIPQETILPATISNPTPTKGSTSGGDEVTITFANFPAQGISDLLVEFDTTNAITGQGGVYKTGVVSLSINAGASVTSSSGSMVIRTPPVNPSAGASTVTVSMRSGPVSFSATFDFEFRPVITGPARLAQASVFPTTIFPSSSIFVAIALGNVPMLELPYQLPSIQGVFGSQAAAPATAIVISTRDVTAFTLEGVPPASGWPVGQLTVSAFLPSTGRARGVQFNVTVVPTPEPIATLPTPQFGRSDTQYTLAFQIWYVEPMLNISDISSVEMATAGLDGTITLTQLEVVDLTSLNGDGTAEDDCLFADCSKFILSVRTPASNPSGDSLGGVANISVVFGGETVGTQFAYRASGEPYLASHSPQSEPVVQEAAKQPTIQVALGNFPSATCKSTFSCAAEAADATVVFDFGNDITLDGTILAAVDNNGLLLVSVRAPLFPRPISAEATISVGGVAVSFPYRYTAAAAYATPLDAANMGGSVVTISSYALMSVPLTANNSAYITATIDGKAATVVSIARDENWLMVDVRVPASTTLGRVPGSIHFDDPNDMIPRSSASFKFSYFAAPTATMLPARATTDGRTTEQGSRRAKITLARFPRIDSAADVSLRFGDVDVSILTIENRVALTSSGTERRADLTVTVPAAAAGVVSVTVTYEGSLSRDGLRSIPDEFYVRAVRRAVTSLTYFVPVPRISSMRWCSSCITKGRCYIAGQCGDGVAPQNDLPLSEQGVATINFENAPAILDEDGQIPADCSVDIQFGEGFGTDVIVIRENRDLHRSTFRVVPPAFLSTGTITLTVTITKRGQEFAASYDVDVILDTLELTCVGGCTAPLLNGPRFIAEVENLPVSAVAATATDQIGVAFTGLLFGLQLEPKDYAVVSSNTSTISVAITPPDCAGCFTLLGTSFFALSVFLQDDPTIFVSQFFFFAAPPQALGAFFDPTGSALIIFFDSWTDLGMMDDTDCSAIFDEAAVASFGNTSDCVWFDFDVLIVLMADGPTVLPGDTLQMKGIRNVLQVSAETDTAPTVFAPLVPRYPSLMVSGPAEIDNCASMEINAVSASPRDLVYNWRGIDPSVADDELTDADRSFDAAVSVTTGPRLFLDSFTPEMVECDRTYNIAVSVVDFLGFESETLIFPVFKRCLPGLQLLLQPTALTTDRSRTISVIAQTTFSTCGDIVPMVYSWSLTDPSLVTPELQTYLDTELVELYIPPHVLTAGVDYEVQCVVGLSTDLTVTNTATMTISVLPQDLMAIVVGGATGIQWGATTNGTHTLGSNLTLDASLSRDPDVVSTDPAAQGLSFEWSCWYDDGTVRDPCVDAVGNAVRLPNVAAPQLLPGSLRASESTPYEFTVLVSKAGRALAEATVQVFVLGESAPEVAIDIGNKDFGSDGTVSIVASDLLVISSTCDNNEGSRQWSIEPAVDLTTSGWAGADSSQLTMFAGANVLMSGAQYTLTHSCTADGKTGTASVKLKVNSPPIGGSCTWCTKKEKKNGKVKLKCNRDESKARALDTLFELSCSNFADPDGDGESLWYRFGYRPVEATDNSEAIWREPSTDNFKEMEFPTGRWTMMAQIADSNNFDAPSTEVVVGDLCVRAKRGKNICKSDGDSDDTGGSGGGRRRLLQAECQEYRDEWAVYMAEINEILLTKNPDALFDQVAVIGNEIKSGVGVANENSTCGALYTDAVSSVEKAAAAMLSSLDNVAVVDQGFVLSAMNKARRVIAGAEFQSIESAANITALARAMLERMGEGPVDEAVVTDLVFVVQSGIQVWTANKDQDAMQFLSDIDVATVQATRRLAVNMGVGEANDYDCADGNKALCTQVSTNFLRKRLVSEVVQMGASTPNSLMNRLEINNVTVMWPASMDTELSLAADSEVSVYMAVHQHVPLAGGMVFHSPMFSVSLYDASEKVIAVKDTSDMFDIMIPLLSNNRTKNEQMRYEAQAGCKYWDHNMNMFSDEGCSSPQHTDHYIVCSCNHLTMFAVVQNETGACGDGILEGQFEQCDDGNDISGDGCNSDCEVESYWSCAQDNGNSQPSVCTVSTVPAFTGAIVHDSNDLQGASNTISVRIFISAPMREGSVVTMSGFVGSETEGSTIDLAVNEASEGLVPNISNWNQTTGTLEIALERGAQVSDTMKFSFVVTNPMHDNEGATVTVSCGNCLVKEPYSTLSMGSISKQTEVLKISYEAPACTNTSLFGADCAFYCVHGTVVGTKCVCPDGVFGATCNQVATLLASDHVLLNPTTSNALSISGRRSNTASFTIPEGAIAADDLVEVTMNLWDVAPTPDAALQTEAGGIIANGIAVVMAPRGQTFLKDITLSLPYDSAAVPTPSGIPTLSTWEPTGHWLDKSTGIWEDLGGSINGQFVDTQTDHFTTFAVMAEEKFPTTMPAFTTALVSDETGLPGVENEVSVRLIFNAPLKKDAIITVSGLLGAGTADTDALAIGLETPSGAAAELMPTAKWTQATGAVEVTLARDMTREEQLKFYFALTNPASDNAAATVTVSCAGCLKVDDARSSLAMASLIKATNVLQTEAAVATCTDSTKYGALCESTCAGVVVGSVCTCAPGFFGDDCSVQGAVLQRTSRVIDPATQSAATVVATADGQGVSVPVGAVTGAELVEVAVKLYSVAPQPHAGQGLLPNGRAQTYGPRGLAFAQDVTLLLDYNAATHDTALYSVNGHWLNRTSGLWEALASGSVVNGLVRSPVRHFSMFAAMLTPIPTTTTTTAEPTTTTPPTTTPPPVIARDQPEDDDDDSSNIGAIVGGILAAWAVIVGAAVFCIYKRNRQGAAAPLLPKQDPQLEPTGQVVLEQPRTPPQPATETAHSAAPIAPYPVIGAPLHQTMMPQPLVLSSQNVYLGPGFPQTIDPNYANSVGLLNPSTSPPLFGMPPPMFASQSPAPMYPYGGMMPGTSAQPMMMGPSVMPPNINFGAGGSVPPMYNQPQFGQSPPPMFGQSQPPMFGQQQNFGPNWI